MYRVKGKYNTAIVYSDIYEPKAIEQIRALCDQPFVKDASIRIMPDYHFGAGCTIGFTANLGDKVVPNLVGVDIGCGMRVVKLGKMFIDFEALEEVIRAYVPTGHMSHGTAITTFRKIKELTCYRELFKTERFVKQIGTLGGGNHFIEVDIDDDGNKYLVIHSGSRNMGKQVADYHQKVAVQDCSQLDGMDIGETKRLMIMKLKEQGRSKEIHNELVKIEEKFKKTKPKYPKALCFVTGQHRADYLKDMQICQEYATLNRLTMADTILRMMFDVGIDNFETFETVHNYINVEDGFIRKGAVSAKKDELFICPMNMRDGSLLCVGKGNEEWNSSCAHGAGRLMGRAEAKSKLKMDTFEHQMEGIFTHSVAKGTLDEAPGAYKPMSEIVDQIGDTADIVAHIKPLYNLKHIDTEKRGRK